jgi:tetratricopeptide (TPR) repeat protein
VKPEPKRAETRPSPAEPPAADQTQVFEKAMALFQRREFAKARDLFQRATTGPLAEVSHAANMHIRMCDRRIGGAAPPLRTPDDHYNYGITLINQHRLDEAEAQLRKAVAGNERAGHYHYALALCCGLRGNLPDAVVHLRRAIEIEPANRIAAVNDADFQSMAGHAALRELLVPERSRPG